MPVLPDSPTLGVFQRYVARLEEERGFAHQDLLQKCLLMGEEMGELFKAVRQVEGIALDRTSRVGEAGAELVDIFIYLCAIANRLDVDLETAFRQKERENAERTWE